MCRSGRRDGVARIAARVEREGSTAGEVSAGPALFQNAEADDADLKAGQQSTPPSSPGLSRRSRLWEQCACQLYWKRRAHPIEIAGTSPAMTCWVAVAEDRRAPSGPHRASALRCLVER